MKLIATWGMLLTSLATGGCATRGALDIACTDLANYARPLPTPQIVADIHSDTRTEVSLASLALDGRAAPEDAAPDPMASSIAALALADQTGSKDLTAARGRPRAVLLLSGGGQWGAFGSGFLSQLKHRGGEHDVDFGVITGVSTGGLQSLFVAIDSPEAYDAMRKAYAPASERAVVERNSKVMAVVTGSLAGLRPLRRRIEDALCAGGGVETDCPLITALADSGRRVFIGFVKARTGQFVYADAVEIAKAGGAGASKAARRNAQQCLTGVALASAAMPVFFQQIRINHETYYDGGVRLSVFEDHAASSIDRGVAAERARLAATAASAQPPPPAVETPALYVVRNGPTVLLAPDGRPGDDGAADEHADALTNAFRAESIVVNQLEVGSIERLRLAHPNGDIWLVTADGYEASRPDAAAGCTKPKVTMFDPTFMQCLQRFGALKANRERPWTALSPLGRDPAATGAP